MKDSCQFFESWSQDLFSWTFQSSTNDFIKELELNSIPSNNLFLAGMRVGSPFVGRQQTSPLGSPQPMPSPGNPSNEMAVSTSNYFPE